MKVWIIQLCVENTIHLSCYDVDLWGHAQMIATWSPTSDKHTQETSPKGQCNNLKEYDMLYDPISIILFSTDTTIYSSYINQRSSKERITFQKAKSVNTIMHTYCSKSQGYNHRDWTAALAYQHERGTTTTAKLPTSQSVYPASSRTALAGNNTAII